MNTKLLLGVFLLLLSTPSFASSPEAWADFHKEVKKACKEQSAFSNPEIIGAVVDTESQAIAIMQGEYTQESMKGELGTVFCLYAKETKKVEVVETSLLSTGCCAINTSNAWHKLSAESEVKEVNQEGEWAVQAASFRTEARASKLVDQLEDKNISSKIVKVGRWYTVRLTSQVDKSTAKQQLELLEKVAHVKGALLEQGKIVEAKPKKATVLSTTKQTKWVVQAGSFLTTTKAQRLANILKARGITPRIVRDGNWHTVRLTPQDSPQAAKQQLQQLHRTAKINGVILKFH